MKAQRQKRTHMLLVDLMNKNQQERTTKIKYDEKTGRYECLHCGVVWFRVCEKYPRRCPGCASKIIL